MHSRTKISILCALITVAQLTSAIKIPYANIDIDNKLLQPAVYALGGIGLGFVATYSWTSYHHPAALEKKKLELAYAQQQRKEQEQLEKEKQKQQQEEQERKKAREAQHKHQEAQQQIVALGQLYAQEIKNSAALQDKEKFYAIIKSKNGNELYPLQHYFQALSHDIHTLRFCATDILDETEKRNHQYILEELEGIRRAYNIALSDTYKHEQEAAKKYKLQQEAIARIVKKEELEIEELKSRIAAHNSTTQANNQIHHVNESLYDIKNYLPSILKMCSETQHMQGKLYNQFADQINTALQKLSKEIDTALKNNGSNKDIQKNITEIKSALEQIQKNLSKNVIVYQNAAPTVPATCSSPSTGTSAGNPPPSFVSIPDPKPSAPPMD